ncbi:MULTISPECIES: DeoR/GlpR family DNA-binding transcription regulator [Neobacillus]|jgi:DeoR family transcriptional regulator, fructose operon transcriptional repressor|uniref:DeoR/GlpR family DNA-binding transcription regulator n=1 Tax=Neobacillus sedimentimangrovi TaxID=2699460 RepID=A0ABS8QIG8_9BACI|nr:DeoR/GlpR family DNA-binding transcription regulator [Neobacillus sedimentimangrovi]AIM15309.1 DeoR faimly transcriptional regulator [Bacillus sp. X1(2014)]MCD4838805.1 DeoR/GlpR family DNA-binding transcription regulator [Neobacillus sedimentimangrovi]
MLTPERHQIILQLLKEKGIVKIQEIMELTNSSESTIRRDLSQLEEQKFLKRIHGGASRLQGKLQELSMIEKSSKNLQEKRMIAKYAASLVEEGDCIYLDAGSTVFEMIQYLPLKDLVVVTNGFMHLPGLISKGITTYILGGLAKSKTNAIIGRSALESLDLYRFDKCFMGVNGIHPQFGYTTPDQEEAMVKQKAISLSREAFVLADNTKFSEISFAKIADIHEATIITNELPDELENQYLNRTTIKVVTA